MSSISSINKIDGFNAITKSVLDFKAKSDTSNRKLGAAVDAINYPLTTNIAKAAFEGSKKADELFDEMATSMASFCDTWGDQYGSGPKAKSAFEDCKANVRKVSATPVTIPALENENPDGLHQTITDETVAGLNKALEEVSSNRYDLIMDIKKAATEYSTEDCAQVYINLGKGLEAVTNALAELVQSELQELKKLGIDIEEVASKLNAQSGSFSESGTAAKAKIANLDADLA